MTIHKPNARNLLLIGVILPILAACAPSNTPTVPTGLERYYDHKLAFGPCGHVPGFLLS